MSKTNETFDNATRVLADHQRSYLGNNLRDYAREMGSAIRVLEAAGKVDKEVVLKFLERRVDEDDDLRDDEGYKIYPKSCVRDLLESLPDKEGK